ncbi:MAG TPA: hypothetical protein VGX03_30270 [Candidatus Binatia bacterium]|jgi:hypothetical protein|nr:hypothetical protein [Candidatus Binatia bacterium]
MPVKAHAVVFAFLMVLALGTWWEATAEERGGIFDKLVSSPQLRDEMRGGFSSRINTLLFGLAQQPVDSRLNFDNRLQIPRYQTELDLRPDFRQTFRGLELSVRPRLELRWRRWEDGFRKHESDTDANFFVHEWLTRYGINDKLFISYGRENLQWGPSYMLSPSNPFNRENGQNNPRLEVPGLDYGRLVWLPSDRWTLSLIANTSEGRQKHIRDFERAYAVKLDYTAQERYGSLIVSHRENGHSRLGFFGGWTVSEALLLYAEGGVPDKADNVEILTGGSYTLAMGPTLTVEFFHQEAGCTRERIDLCFSPGPSGVEPADVFFRKSYVLVQYLHTRIRDTANFTLRWIGDLDDSSGRLINIFDYEIGDHAQVFSIASGRIGGQNTEFGSLLEYSLMVGVGYTF